MDSIGGGVRGGGVGWGGVVWADNVHVRLRNYVMLRWCNVLARLHIYAVLRWCNVLARLHIYAVLRWCNVHVRLHIYAVLRWCNVLARLHIYTCEMKQMLLKLFVVWCRNWSLKKMTQREAFLHMDVKNTRLCKSVLPCFWTKLTVYWWIKSRNSSYIPWICIDLIYIYISLYQ